MARPCISVCAVAFIAAVAWMPSAQAATPPGDGPTIHASAEELLVLAGRLIAHRQPDKAISILRTLSADPNPTVRNEARYRWSMLLQTNGSLRAAADILGQILEESPNLTKVRLELAQLLDGMGDKDGAWRQIRAAQRAGLPPKIARIVDRYSERLRAERPVGASFEIAIAPDTNIGRSTRLDRLSTVIGDFEIDEESQAKSGLGLGLRGQAFRRVQLGKGRQSALVRLSGSADLYRQSSFNEIAFDIAAGPELEIGRSQVKLELGLTQRWYGQRPFLRAARIAGVATLPVGRRSRLWLNGSAFLVDHRVNDLQDGKVFSTAVTLERALTSRAGLSASVGGDRASLRDPGYSTRSLRAGILVWRDVGSATLTAEVETGRLQADERLLLFPSMRRDKSLRFSVGSTLRQLTFAGFAPVTRLIVERNQSTIEFYDYKRVRTEFGLVRSF